jgi:predicted TIM-barrel fold metal-dependent hydrolase
MPRKRAALLALLLVAPPSAAQTRIPIYDTHAHYSSPAWGQYDAGAILRNFVAAGVTQAIVSSTPDEGTQRLRAADPARIVAMLRPYRDNVGPGDWYNDQASVAYVAERLARGSYVGVGEVHLYDRAAAEAPVVRAIARLVADRGLVLHVHSDAAPIEALYAHTPGLRILWAHAGLGVGATEIAATMARFPELLMEVALRAGEIAPGGQLDPTWRELLQRHSDQVMIGTDTWITPRWSVYPEIVEEHRRWLALLPPAVATRIAHANAERVFGLPKP